MYSLSTQNCSSEYTHHTSALEIIPSQETLVSLKCNTRHAPSTTNDIPLTLSLTVLAAQHWAAQTRIRWKKNKCICSVVTLLQGGKVPLLNYCLSTFIDINRVWICIIFMSPEMPDENDISGTLWWRFFTFDISVYSDLRMKWLMIHLLSPYVHSTDWLWSLGNTFRIKARKGNTFLASLPFP